MYSKQWLLDELGRGERAKYLFFWGHQPKADGGAGAHCLSQWWPSAFEVDGLRFRTTEHFMMWRKARMFGDERAAEQVLAAEHPGQAKKIGRTVAGFDEQRWERARFEVVVAGNVAKFGQEQQLSAYLAGTGDRVLVEASPVDPIWGIGLAADDPAAAEPATWPGLNLLGFALMAARDVLTGRVDPAAATERSA
ncbi:NADAR family protein [Nocardia higoensis]|uniref:NADAR family protein n=1 Tax=Nocardia higoensis TaxID=228599 RepID=A0ABS0DF99_9NOCA|nr:NADAR family protein [Nocardia higoensis]MBF6357131.1 NADAR family protein [Nocardia higoensis]